MNVFDELQARGMIAQVTDETAVREKLGQGGVRFYIGFDPTADSFHAGNFVQMMIMAHMQRAGHTPIVLFGGGTGMVADPTGKSELRQILTPEVIAHNIACFKVQMERFIDFSDGKAMLVNNADWLMPLNYVDFIREIGVHFSVNRMLAAECYKQRMERGLTFFELNYMVMQSYDFLELSRRYNCTMQFGGDEQWSNIIGGVELCRRVDQREVYGMTSKLLLTGDGRKMGKTEKGAVWLDPDKTPPYEFYQYWRNVADADVVNCMKMLTFIPVSEISGYEQLSGGELNAVKERLAYEVTALVHGKAAAQQSLDTARALFASAGSADNMPAAAISRDQVQDGGVVVIDMMIAAAVASSRSDARRLIEQGGVSVDDVKVTDVNARVPLSDFDKGHVVIKKGKKVYVKITVED